MVRSEGAAVLVGDVVNSGRIDPVAIARTATADWFAVAIDRHYAPLLRYLTRQTGSPELAADLVQETFLAAYRAIDQLSDERAMVGWLYQIARNQLRMELRRRRVRRFVSLEWLSARADAVIPALRRADGSAGLHERDRIQQVLDELSPALREALLLHSLCGFTGEEVGRILGISAAAARKRIGRASTEFRLRYGAEASENDEDEG
jgi:RNA polymerase sigma factor (sigma-70 family)